jgi:hypothetical protein
MANTRYVIAGEMQVNWEQNKSMNMLNAYSEAKCQPSSYFQQKYWNNVPYFQVHEMHYNLGRKN